MKRPIRFRAKLKSNGSWIEWNLGELIDLSTLDLDTLGQFTGVQDEAKNDLWEDDILYWVAEPEPRNTLFIGVITYFEGRFRFKSRYGWQENSINEYRMVKRGNIYDNPELFEKDKKL